MPKELVLFIHGLGGKSNATWGMFEDLLKKDAEIKDDIEIGFFDFPTTLWSIPFGIKPLKIQELADALKTEISLKYSHFKRIVIVAHSLGGLIAQRYVIDAVNYNRQNTISDILLFGTPNYGSILARVGAILSFKHWQMLQLMPHSDITTDISKDWDRLDCDNKFRTLYIIGGQDSVVERSSASRVKGVATETIADKGHIDLVKPQRATDLSYLIVKRAIQGAKFRSGADRVSIKPIKVASEISPRSKRGRSLFDHYSRDCEPFYIGRREDFVIKSYMDFQNLWIWGPSGYGKTTSLVRALVQIGCEYRVVSVGHYAGETAQDIFLGLIRELSDDGGKFEDCSSWPSIIKEAASCVAQLSKRGCKWIMVEEIPLDEGGEYIAFVNKLMLLIHKAAEQNGSHTIGFLFSSVKDPTASISAVPKMLSVLKILQVGSWRNFDALGLMKCIADDTKLYLSDVQIKEVLKASNNSPRMIKVFYINYISLNGIGGSFEDAMVDTFSVGREA